MDHGDAAEYPHFDRHSQQSQLNSQVGKREKSGAPFKICAKHERELILVDQYIRFLCLMELFNCSKSVVSSPGLPKELIHFVLEGGQKHLMGNKMVCTKWASTLKTIF